MRQGSDHPEGAQQKEKDHKQHVVKSSALSRDVDVLQGALELANDKCQTLQEKYCAAVGRAQYFKKVARDDEKAFANQHQNFIDDANREQRRHEASLTEQVRTLQRELAEATSSAEASDEKAERRQAKFKAASQSLTAVRKESKATKAELTREQAAAAEAVEQCATAATNAC